MKILSNRAPRSWLAKLLQEEADSDVIADKSYIKGQLDALKALDGFTVNHKEHCPSGNNSPGVKGLCNCGLQDLGSEINKILQDSKRETNGK